MKPGKSPPWLPIRSDRLGCFLPRVSAPEPPKNSLKHSRDDPHDRSSGHFTMATAPPATAFSSFAVNSRMNLSPWGLVRCPATHDILTNCALRISTISELRKSLGYCAEFELN